MEKHQTYFNLLDALKEKGCPICNLAKKNIHMAMDSFLYERVNDPGARKEIRKSLGYCNTHAWQLQKFGDGFGLSIIFNELLGILNEKISRVASSEEKKEIQSPAQRIDRRQNKVELSGKGQNHLSYLQ